MLTRAKRSLINNNDDVILNSWVEITIPIQNLDKEVMIVQRNATWYTINWIQRKQFANVHNRDIILFSKEHLHIKKDGGQIVDDTDLLTV